MTTFAKSFGNARGFVGPDFLGHSPTQGIGVNQFCAFVLKYPQAQTASDHPSNPFHDTTDSNWLSPHTEFDKVLVRVLILRLIMALKVIVAGLVTAIHVLSAWIKDVDARHKAGHDGAGKRLVTVTASTSP
jgi:hypothetical protein